MRKMFYSGMKAPIPVRPIALYKDSHGIELVDAKIDSRAVFGGYQYGDIITISRLHLVYLRGNDEVIVPTRDIRQAIGQ